MAGRRGRPWDGPPVVRAGTPESTRDRSTQIDARARENARMENVLQDAGVKGVSTTIWPLLTHGRLYDDPGADVFARRHDP